MRIRDGRRQVHDMLASPAHVDSHYSFNTNAVASEPFVAPVERRFLNPVELARIHEQEPVPYLPVVTVAERAAAMAVARMRGGQATKRNRAESLAIARKAAWQGRTNNTKVSAEAILEALRLYHGNQALAADFVGLTRPALRERVRTMQRRESLPADIAATLRGRGGWRKAA